MADILKKTIYTLVVDNFAPEITAITFPLLKHYAHKIGAEFKVLTERKFPNMPPVYEKLQLYELSKLSDWTIYIDADALVHPDCPDWTITLDKDTVAHNGKDFAPIRWRMDKYFRRDGRRIGSGNWFTLASDWCSDLWHPLEDLTPEEAYNNIFPTTHELRSGIDRTHLIDDYTLSRNIARYGLKFTTLRELQETLKLGTQGDAFMYHQYTVSVPEKIKLLKEIIVRWQIGTEVFPGEQLEEFYKSIKEQQNKPGAPKFENAKVVGI